MKTYIFVMMALLALLCVGSAAGIELRTWSDAPYNVGVGNYYTDLGGVKKIKQRISGGDCVYPSFLSAPIVYGDYADYRVTRNYVEIVLRPGARWVQVFVWADGPGRCVLGTKYVADRGWLSLNKRSVSFTHDYGGRKSLLDDTKK